MSTRTDKATELALSEGALPRPASLRRTPAARATRRGGEGAGRQKKHQEGFAETKSWLLHKPSSSVADVGEGDGDYPGRNLSHCPRREAVRIGVEPFRTAGGLKTYEEVINEGRAAEGKEVAEGATIREGAQQPAFLPAPKASRVPLCRVAGSRRPGYSPLNGAT